MHGTASHTFPCYTQIHAFRLCPGLCHTTIAFVNKMFPRSTLLVCFILWLTSRQSWAPMKLHVDSSSRLPLELGGTWFYSHNVVDCQVGGASNATLSGIPQRRGGCTSANPQRSDGGDQGRPDRTNGRDMAGKIE
ncbi:hypothetical protein PHET_08289 [Paragonimus heterotremus]|uniref:Uncharacterized protein n=1 Tax=Paragonimus heterotremus TaxID=100268 RepID=A0A8J4WVR2_9TREM|nr:hypothetical protein PHET_08289 [Paragonimus heterotremus]